MRIRSSLPLLAIAVLVGAGSGDAMMAKQAVASATLLDASGAAKGSVRIVDGGSGLRLTVTATGLPPGIHGVHLHTVGTCTAPAFASAGGHWNPTAKHHGMNNPDGMHMGDLPNLTIAADGSGALSFTIAGASLQKGANPLLDGDGAAVVIHAAADDYMTDPSGNSGGRIACGVLHPGKA